MILYLSEKDGIDGSCISFEAIPNRFRDNSQNIKGIKIEYSNEPLIIAPSHKLFSFGVQKSQYNDKKYSMSLILKDDDHDSLIDAINTIEKECEKYVRRLPDRPRLQNSLKVQKDRSKRLNVKITPNSRFYDSEKNKSDYTNLSLCNICPALLIDSMYIVDGKAYIQFKIDEAIVIPRKTIFSELTLDLSKIKLDD